VFNFSKKEIILDRRFLFLQFKMGNVQAFDPLSDSKYLLNVHAQEFKPKPKPESEPPLV